MSEKFTAGELATAGLIACTYQTLKGKYTVKELNDFATWCLDESKKAHQEEHEQR